MKTEKLYSSKEASVILGRTQKAMNYFQLKFGKGRLIAGRLCFTETEVNELKELIK